MLKFSGHQALKAFRGPLRNALHIRHIHVERAPFSGPPSYATIARRFTSHPNPLTFFTEKKAKEASERGEFIDIHDIGGVSPKDYDVLITDMDDKKLRSEVAELIGIPYLKKTTNNEANQKVDIGHGIIYGNKFRVLFPCVVGLKDEARWVFFIMDSGAPLTYLSVQAAEVLDINRGPAPVTIAGYHHSVHLSPPKSHFADINILGYDFCNAFNVAVAPNRDKGTVKLYFSWGDSWEAKREEATPRL